MEEKKYYPGYKERWKMKIIIISSHSGAGHYSAAKNIEEKIRSMDDYKDAEILHLDLYENIFKKNATAYYKISKTTSSAFRGLYNNAHGSKGKGVERFFNSVCDVFFPIFKKTLLEEDPDLVISTYSFVNRFMKRYRQKCGYLPFITRITDVYPSKFRVNDYVDYYLVANEDTKKALQGYGVKEYKIIVGGIPVSQKIYQKKTSHSGKKNLLLMGGGLGLLPTDKAFYYRLDSREDVEVSVICGKNKKLYRNLQTYKNLKAYAYVNNVDEFLKKTDLYLTKAGGLTSYECIFSETPVLIFDPFLDQEKFNADFLVEIGLGEIYYENDDPEKIRDLLFDDERLSAMIFSARMVKDQISPYALEMALDELRGEVA